jgi:hypothetical protein
MKNLFVSYKIAKLLKKRGFDEPCLGYFAPLKTELTPWYNPEITNQGEFILAPIHQQALGWLLEKHNLDIYAHKMWHYSYNYEEKRMETFYQVAVSDFTIDREERDAHGGRIYQKYISSTLLKTYKEAIEDGITWALKHIK